MTESQSRYSIVERLTDKKLDIMSATSDLDEEIKDKKQLVEEHKKALADWENDVKEDVERHRESKEASYGMKIAAINEALIRIEEISKTAPQVQ